MVGPTPRNVSVDFRSNTVFVGNDDSLTVIDADKNALSFEIENATSSDPGLATGLIYATTDLVFFDDSGASGRVDVFAVPRKNGGKGQD